MENFKLTQKQAITLEYLKDPNINEVLFGGGAGGGKSQCGCFSGILSSTDVIDNCWIDNAKELVKACVQLGYRRP